MSWECTTREACRESHGHHQTINGARQAALALAGLAMLSLLVYGVAVLVWAAWPWITTTSR